MDLKNQFYTNDNIIDCPFCKLRFTTSDGRVPKHDCNKPAVKEREFQVIKKTGSEVQKVMNQWRHDYNLEIVHVQGYSDSDFITVCLWRTPK